MIKQISPIQTAELMASDGLFAVFDVRERGEYNDGQIANTTSLAAQPDRVSHRRVGA